MSYLLQINYNTVGGFEGNVTPEEAIDTAARLGYDGVELAFGGPHFGPGVAAERFREVKKYAAAKKVALASLCSGFYWGCSLSDPRAVVRAQAVAYTKEYLRVAHEVGAKTILALPGVVNVPWDETYAQVAYQDAWKMATASLRRCLPLAKELGVNIGLENVWNWFLADPYAMRAFVDQFKSPRLGVYFDAGNVLINGRPQDWVRILGKRIKALHVKNFTRTDGCGGLHGFGDDLLAGDLNWDELKKALLEIGYKGPVTAEMIPFCRLPDLVLPDLKLAADTAPKLRRIFD